MHRLFGSSGSCALVLVPAILAAQTPPAVPPLRIDGTLASSDPAARQRPGSWADAYEVSLSAGQSVRIEVSSELDTMVYVYDPAGTLVAQDDDSGDGLAPRVELTAPSAGSYTIEVTTFAAALGGDYSLVVTATAEIVDAQVSDGTLARGDGASRTRSGSRADAYSVRLEAGDSVRAWVESTAFDPMIYVYGPGGELVGQDDDGGEGLNSRIEFRAASPGVHVVEVTAYESSSSGPYRLTIATLGPPATPGAAGPPRPTDAPSAGVGSGSGEALDGEPAGAGAGAPVRIATGVLPLGGSVRDVVGGDDVETEYGFVDAWLLELPAGSVVELTTRSETIAPSIAVLGPDGRVLRHGFAQGDTTVATARFCSASGGTYRVAVTGYDAAYSLSATPLALVESGTVEAPVDMEFGSDAALVAPDGIGSEAVPVAAFSLDEWATVSVRVSGLALAPHLWGFGVRSAATGTTSTLLPLVDDSGATLVADLPPGRHAIVAEPGGYAFTARVEVVSGVWEPGVPLGRGMQIEGRLEAGRRDGNGSVDPRSDGDIQCHALRLEAPATVLLSASAGDFHPLLSVIDDAGVPAFGEAAGAASAYAFERAGTMWVCVSGGDGEGASGAYTVLVE